MSHIKQVGVKSLGLQSNTVVYLSILERAQDPVALRLGIICSDLFTPDVKERARRASNLEALQSLVQEQRRLLESA